MVAPAMAILKNLNLRTKFLLGLAAMMAVAGIFFVGLLQQYLREALEQEARGKAQVILRGVESLHAYVQDNLRPAITGVMLDDKDLLEAMSCTALARAAMGPGGASAGADYRFRRVAIGARSPDLEATGLERDFILRFQDEPARQWSEAFVSESGQEFLVMAQPVRYQGFCLRCHGDPARAPRDLVEAYGPERGFNRQEGELAGAHIVSLPMQGKKAQIRGATLGFVLMFSLGALILFSSIYVFFNRLVVHNLRRALTVMGRHLPEAVAAPRPSNGPRSSDEIEQMLGSMERFAQSLRQARAQLQAYASNLEAMVDARTLDLTREAEDRRADVGLFVNLLNGLNHTRDRQEIVDGCLELIGRRFGAGRVSYRCAAACGPAYSWPDATARPELPQGWERLAAGGLASVEGLCAHIPVRASGTAQGMLTVCFAPETAPASMPLDVLTAVGQQLGVVLENLDALDNLVRQNDLLQAVFEGIGDPVMLLDATGSVVLANESASSLDAPPATPQEPARASLGGARLLRDALGIVSGRPLPPEVLAAPALREVRLAAERVFLVSLFPLPEYQERGGRLVVYAREVTRERRMRDTAQHNEKLLAVGRLAAGLAHEINNPLGVILFYGELLKAQAGDAAREDVEVILRHTRQAQKVLRDLLDFVRPKKSALGPCDLGLIVRRTAGVFQVQAAAEKMTLSVDAPQDLPEVLADPMALEQILSNLILNALDAVAPGGHIRVTAGADRAEAWVSVADDGPGIPPEHLGRIFDPFFTTKEVGKGTGLGLAVVYGLANDMGGSVEAANGGGAVFTVRLRLAPDKEASHAAP